MKKGKHGRKERTNKATIDEKNTNSRHEDRQKEEIKKSDDEKDGDRNKKDFKWEKEKISVKGTEGKKRIAGTDHTYKKKERKEKVR
jgi:hypothetical protein